MKVHTLFISPRIKFLFSYIVFLGLLFFASKVLFLVVYLKHTLALDLSSLTGIFWHGLKLDFSVIGYILIFPLVILFVSSLIKGRFAMIILKIYNYFLLILAPILIISDLALYKFWGFRLDNTPLLYIKNPDEMVASVSFGLVFMGVLASVLLSSLLIFLFNRFVINRLRLQSNSTLTESIFLFLFIPFLIIPVRGGFNTSPVNLSTAYFHSDNFANHAAINLLWNIGYSFTNSETRSNPYKFLPGDTATRYFETMICENLTKERFLSVDRPNIILIILESFTSKIIEPLRGIAGVAPSFNNMCNSGILFENYYANGDRSDKGIIALLSGFPALGNTSLMKFPNKSGKLQAFPRDLKTIGYNLSFYYGGDIEFFNLKSYLIACGFENIVSDKDFKQERHLSKWGAPDEFVFDRLYDDLSGQNETPYFKVLYTLSNHDPFDIPGKPKFGRSNEDNKFFSAVYYTDSCLNEFVMKLKKSDLWNNTLLILVADHGSRMPGNIPNQAVENFSIPMIWTGGAIRKDSIISKYAMQTDLPKTLLNQLSMDTREYKFSSDIFSCENAGFAHYSYNEGFGFLTDTLKYIFNINSEKLTVNEGKINEYSILSGKSFLQTAYQDFLEY